MARLMGILGGTFDPPHWGHLILAEGGRETFRLERVLWVVAGDPPHKSDTPVSAVAHRVEMVRRAIANNPHFSLSRVDIDRPGPHYSVDSMQLLAEEYPGVEFVYLMGEDSLIDLPKWHEPEQFVSQIAWLGVMHRPGTGVDFGPLQEVIPGLREKVRFFEAPRVGISGHNIRNRVAEGRSIRYLLPQKVCEYIKEVGLYR